MSCRSIRNRLTQADAGAPPAPAVAEHLADCDACRRFADRLARARLALRRHHADVEPDGQFAAGVLERVHYERWRRSADDGLGWAALRLLPVATLLAALVAWSALQPHGGAVSLLLPGVGDDVLTVFVVSGLDEVDLDAPGPRETQP